MSSRPKDLTERRQRMNSIAHVLRYPALCRILCVLYIGNFHSDPIRWSLLLPRIIDEETEAAKVEGVGSRSQTESGQQGLQPGCPLIRQLSSPFLTLCFAEWMGGWKHGWMNEERLSGRASALGSEGEARQGCCEHTHVEWVRQLLGAGMTGSGAWAQVTRWLVGHGLWVS